jgi:hypothetical protein
MTSVSTFTTPLLADKIAQELNTELASTFDDQYPICSVGVEGDETYPEVYKNDGTKISYRVMPDDARSLSFFTIEGNMSEQDEDEYHLSVPMGFTFWVNLQKYNPAKDYDYTSELIRDVLNILRAYGCAGIEVNITDPFEGFSLLQRNIEANTMRPYSAVKITFTKNVPICIN